MLYLGFPVARCDGHVLLQKIENGVNFVVWNAGRVLVDAVVELCLGP